jgi:hypothetical protein
MALAVEACPVRSPFAGNERFNPTVAAAREERSSDVVARAMRLIADGAVYLGRRDRAARAFRRPHQPAG